MKGKKYLYLGVLLTLMCLMLNISSVKAGVDAVFTCSDVVKESDTRAYKDCSLTLKITEYTVQINTVTGKFNLHNVTLDKGNIKMEKDWYLEEVDGQYQITTTKTELPIGDYKLGTFRFYKVVYADACTVNFQPTGYKLIERKCTEYQGTYYGKAGNIVEKNTYEDQCLEKPKICVKENSDYYGKDGTKVNKSQYEKDCETHKCYQYDDGTYAGVNGDIVELDQYNRECNQGKHYCENYGGSYYDDKGNTTNEETFNALCKSHYCEVIPAGDAKEFPIVDGKIYFNKAGKAVSKEEYNRDCFKHYCEHIEIGGTHTYFDKSGNTTTEATYNLECLKHYCEVVGDTYFGIYGEDVSKEEYDKECGKHYCEIIEDIYYNKNGDAVSKEDYLKSCSNPDNPNTGNFIPFIPLIILIAGGTSIYFYTKKEKKLM